MLFGVNLQRLIGELLPLSATIVLRQVPLSISQSLTYPSNEDEVIIVLSKVISIDDIGSGWPRILKIALFVLISHKIRLLSVPQESKVLVALLNLIFDT